MSTRILRSPATGTAAAATVPFKLAQRHNGKVRWRERADGEIEVALVRRDGFLERRLVIHDGTTSPLEAVPPRGGWHRGPRALVLGLVLVAAAVAYDATGGALRAGQVLTVVGVALALGGAVVRSHEGNVDNRVRRLELGDWNEATDLKEWAPTSAAQLGAVERIANARNGVARVSADTTGAAHVYVDGARTLESYVIGRHGDVEDATTIAARRYTIVGTGSACAGLVIAVVALFLGGDYRLALAAFAAGLVIGFAADRVNPAERRLRELRRHAGSWHEIRTKIEEGD